MKHHPDDDPQTAFHDTTFRETAIGLPKAQRRMPPPAQKTPWGWATTGIVLGIALCVLFFAPARWLTWAVEQSTNTRLQMPNAQGSLWNGSAQLVLSAGEGSTDRTALPGRFTWQLRPSFEGFKVVVGAACCIQQEWRWTVKPRFNGFQVSMSDTPSVWPTALLQGLGTPWNTLQLQGTLTLSTQQLVLQSIGGQWSMQGSAQLNAADVSTSLSTLRPVGSYRLTLTGGETATLQLATLQGPLLLSGQGQWVGGRLRFTGEATAEPDREAALVTLLNILGRREGARSIIKVG